MPDYRVTLTFKDAGLFQRPKRNGMEQIMLTPSGPVNREDNKAYADAPANTLLRACVANMFRVLLGYRPMPTFRGATAPHVQDSECALATSLAERAVVCIKSGITTNKSGEEYLIRELQNTNKHANSWAKSSVLWAGPHPLTYRVSWMSVLSEFGQEIGTEFINMVQDVLGEDAMKLDMVSVFSALYMLEDKSKVKEFFAQNKVSKFYYDTLIEGKTTGQYFGHSGLHGGLRHWYWHLLNKGINQVSRRSGTITLDVSVDELRLLRAGPTMATILDGGFVEITDIQRITGYEDIEGVPTYDHEAA
jgi:hypothetical protein